MNDQVKNRSRIIYFFLMLLLLLNIFSFSRPFHKSSSMVLEWRKGPLIYASSPYSTINAAKIFFPVLAIMLDGYISLVYFWKKIKAKRKALVLNKFPEILVIPCFFLLVLISGEGLTRAFIHNFMFIQYRPDPELYWYNRPNLRDHIDETDSAPRSTNSIGFRGSEEIPEYKELLERRILLLGDSSTFGLGVPDESAYSYVLENVLNKMIPSKVRVFNSACPGHTSYQGLIIMKRYAKILKPDLVIWAYNNDPCLDMVQEKDRVYSNPVAIKIQKILYKSDLYLLFRRVVLDTFYRFRLEDYMKKYSSNQADWVRRIPFDDYKAYLNEFVRLSKFYSCDIMFVRMPLNRPSCKRFPIYYTSFDDEYREYLMNFCQENELPCIDFEKIFLNDYDESLFLTDHLFHPSAKGHKIIGELMAAYIIEKGLIKSMPENVSSMRKGR